MFGKKTKVGLFVLLISILLCSFAYAWTWTLEDDGTMVISGPGALVTNWMSEFVKETEFGRSAKAATSLIIEEGITSISEYTFRDCTNLKSVTIPSSVTEIGYEIFTGCTALESVNWNSSVTAYNDVMHIDDAMTIGAFDDFFYGCTNLKSINIGVNHPTCCSIDGVVFSKDKTKLYYCPRGVGSAYVIPNHVTQINPSAFSGCKELTSVTIPYSVSSTGNYAFKDCTQLTSVNLSEGVTKIGLGSFMNCAGLTSISFPTSIRDITNRAFYGCTNLKEVKLNSYVHFRNDSFDEDTVLIVPEGSIAEGDADRYNYKYKSYMADQWRDWYYGHGVYQLNHKKLTATLISGISKGITNLIMPASIEANNRTYKVTEIASDACKGMTELKSVTIGVNVLSIGNNAFASCSKLSSVYNNGTAVISDTRRSGENGNQTASLVTIGANAFKNCGKLKTFRDFPDLKTIGNSAFQGCTTLTSFTIGSKVKTIGKKAFYGDKKLKTITIKSTLLTKNSIGGNAFKNIYSKATIKCPKKKLEDYKAILLKKGATKTMKIK